MMECASRQNCEPYSLTCLPSSRPSETYWNIMQREMHTFSPSATAIAQVKRTTICNPAGPCISNSCSIHILRSSAIRRGRRRNLRYAQGWNFTP